MPSKREAVMAAVPPGLFGLALGTFLLGHVPLTEVVLGGATPYRVVDPSFGPLLVPGLISLLLVLGGLFGASERLPRWSYTWAEGGLMAVLFSLVLLGDELPYLLSPTVDVVLVLVLLGAIAAVGLVAVKRSPFDAGLVGLGCGAVFALAVTFFATAGPFSRIDVGLLTVPASLVFALAIYGYARGAPMVQRLCLAVAIVLSGVLIWGYKSIILGVKPALADTTFHWKLLAMALAGLLGPIATSWLVRELVPARN